MLVEFMLVNETHLTKRFKLSMFFEVRLHGSLSKVNIGCKNSYIRMKDNNLSIIGELVKIKFYSVNKVRNTNQ